MKFLIAIIIIVLFVTAGGLGVRCYKLQNDLRLANELLALPCWVTHEHLRKGGERR